MKFLKMLILVAIAFNVQFSMAQEDRLPTANPDNDFTNLAPAELHEKCSEFFAELIKGDYNEAYKKLLKKSPILKKKEDVETLLKQTKRAIRLYGNMSGFEPVSFEAATKSYVRLRYLSIHEDLPMRWIFTFYKSPKRGWIVSNVRFDDMTEFFFSDE